MTYFFEYTLSKEDFVAHLKSITSSHIKERKGYNKILMPVILIGFSAYLFWQESYLSASMTLCFAIFYWLLYNGKLNILFKNRYDALVEKTYKDLLGTQTKVYVEQDKIVRVNPFHHSYFKFSAVQKIIEDKSYCFITFKDANTIILPKDKLNDFEINAFVEMLKEKSGLI